MSKKKLLAFIAVILTVVLAATAISVAAVTNQKATLNISVVTTKSLSNDLVKALNENYSGVKVYSTLDTALNNVETDGTKGIMVLADNYPNSTTAITDAQAVKINELGVRVYVEYPTVNETLGIVGYDGTATMGYDRAIVTDADAMGMEIYSLLYVHGAQYVKKTDITDSWLVNATVVGYDTVEFYDEETGELTDCTPYSMLEVNDAGNVLIASTKLSQFISGRYAPYARWQSLWMSVISWVAQADRASLNAIEWTPALNPNYGPDEELADDAYSEAVRMNVEWFLNSTIMPKADGTEGIYECLKSGNQFNVYGDSYRGKNMRSDCNAESLGAIALAGALLNNEEYKTVAYNVMDWLLNESSLANGVRADETSSQYGLLDWHSDLNQYYGDDNAKAILGLMLGAAALETDEFDERILEAILANFRTTGVNGFRGAMLRGDNLDANGWEYYYNRTNYVNYQSHFESLLWATYLWAYDQTGYEPLLERTKTAISLMMTAYDNTMAGDADNSGEWYWTNGLQQERAKMILPLAWLVRVEPTDEHIGWLDKMITDMMAYQDEATGALREVRGENGIGVPVYTQFEKNSDYGKHESPVIQNNGDPCTDALYTSSFAMMTLNESYAVMKAIGNTELADKYKNYTTSLSDYFVRIQQVSSNSYYNGVWFRGFDYEKWETYGSDGDAGWGIWCAETGWCQAWISAALSMQEMGTNIWDYTQTTTVDDHFVETAVLMLNYDPGDPTVSTDTTLKYPVEVVIDGAYGSTAYNDGKWTGVEGPDFTITIDYQIAQSFDSVQIGVLHNMAMGISSPASIIVSGSADGNTYTQLGVWNTTKDLQSEYDNCTTIGALIERLVVETPGAVARYVKVEYKNPGTFQHKAFGVCKTWMFTDEIELNSKAATMDSLASLINNAEQIDTAKYQPATVLALDEAYKAAVAYYNSANPDSALLQTVYDNLNSAIEGLKTATPYSIVTYNPAWSWGSVTSLVDGLAYDQTKGAWKVLTDLNSLTEQEIEIIIDMGATTGIHAIGYIAESRPTYGKYTQNAEFFVSDSQDGPWTSVGYINGREHAGDPTQSAIMMLAADANGGEGRYVKVVFSRCDDYQVTRDNGTIALSEWLYLNEIMINEYVLINADAENATVSLKGADGKELSILGAKVGDGVTVTVTPATGYYVSSVTVNGAAVTLTDGSFVIENITAAQTIAVECVAFSADELPTIVVKDWFITPGQSFDPLTDIYAYDKNGKDISSSVKVIANNIGTTAGTYTVIYYVADEAGASVEATAKVYVVNNLSGTHVLAITPSTSDNLGTMAQQMVDGKYATPGTGHGAKELVSWKNTAYIEIVIALGGNIGIADLGYSLAACPMYGFLPPDVDFYVADELGEWTNVGTVEAVVHPYENLATYDYIKKFIALDDIKASYVKAVIRFDDNPEILANYAGTPGKGIPEWTFTDEIIINPYYSVTAGETENGSVTVTTNSTSGALYGESATVTFTPADGYILSGVTVNGVAVKVTGNTYTITGIKKHTVVEASFSKPSIISASVNLTESIALVYYAVLDDVSDAEMSFTMNGNTITVKGVATANTNVYAFVFKDIAPQCMGDTVKAELVVGGEVIDTVEEFSVRAYADATLSDIENKAIAGYNDEQYAALATLIADMLEYGAAAQKYTGYKNEEGNLVNEGIGGKSDFTELTEDTGAVLGDSTSEDLYLVSSGIRFDYVNSLYFKLSATNVDNVVIKVTNEATGEVAEYTAADLVLTDGNVYTLYTDGVAPTEFDTRYTVELCDGETVVQTLEYGVSAYVYYIQGQSSAMAELARALYNYGVSACKYKELT